MAGSSLEQQNSRRILVAWKLPATSCSCQKDTPASIQEQLAEQGSTRVSKTVRKAVGKCSGHIENSEVRSFLCSTHPTATHCLAAAPLKPSSESSSSEGLSPPALSPCPRNPLQVSGEQCLPGRCARLTDRSLALLCAFSVLPSCCCDTQGVAAETAWPAVRPFTERVCWLRLAA